MRNKVISIHNSSNSGWKQRLPFYRSAEARGGCCVVIPLFLASAMSLFLYFWLSTPFNGNNKVKNIMETQAKHAMANVHVRPSL